MSNENDCFVTHDFIVARTCILSRKDVKQIIRIPYTSTYKIVTVDDHHLLNIDESEFQIIKKSMNENQKLRHENETLKMHISLSPGGDEYLQAQQRFNENKYK